MLLIFDLIGHFRLLPHSQLQLQQEKEDLCLLSKKLEGKTLITSVSVHSYWMFHLANLTAEYLQSQHFIACSQMFLSLLEENGLGVRKSDNYPFQTKEVIIHWYKVRSQGGGSCLCQWMTQTVLPSYIIVHQSLLLWLFCLLVGYVSRPTFTKGMYLLYGNRQCHLVCHLSLKF